ncbi:MAG: glycosyltransferase family 4 protein, partial [Calothrix sp. SM1_7_51]|nr:glycosyltransferase family 4 protein [Calothrix sp. SM1_7_51]
LHNHLVYCPSGTKYLANQQKICDRNFSVLGCTWGKFVDGCGSRRPGKTIGEFIGTHKSLNIAQKKQINFIANSEYVRGQLIKSGIPSERTFTLYNGSLLPEISVEPLTLEIHKNHRILFAGRIVPDKGLEWLLKTLLHVDAKIQLDIAGEGWDKPRLENLAKKLGLTDRIIWHGWCDGDKLNKLYEQAFAVIFPSVWPEPAGLITLEAYARYRPVIASAVGGIPEHVSHGETGILVSALDIKQLADVINNLSSNYHRCLDMGKRGRDLLVKKFSMSVHVKNLQAIYERTIAE